MSVDMGRKISVLIKTVIVLLLTFSTLSVNAQRVWGSDKEWTGKETKEEAWRKMIDIDMSVPDFNTKKIDQKVMGWKLAKIIDTIQKSYNQGLNNRILSSIRYEQTEDPQIRFVTIDKWNFVNAEKKDSIIIIKWHSLTKLNKKEKVEHDIFFKFVNGITDSERINEFLSDIARYIKPDEDE